ncbi:MAG: peptide-methionine (R)-S-oxide reductase MsrB [Planctomycetota bacterium]
MRRAALRVLLPALLALSSCHAVGEPAGDAVLADGAPEASAERIAAEHVERTDREWRRQLSSKAYRVTRRRQTERAWSGEYVREDAPGTYRCVCCGLALFRSELKYDAKCGWPTFSAPIDDAHVVEHEDRRGGFRRTEVTCARCDAHLGHVFERGPTPESCRYCINSVALVLDEDVPGEPRR